MVLYSLFDSILCGNVTRSGSCGTTVDCTVLCELYCTRDGACCTLSALVDSEISVVRMDCGGW